MTGARREPRAESTTAPPDGTLGIRTESVREPVLWAAAVLTSRETPTWSRALAAAAILRDFTHGR